MAQKKERKNIRHGFSYTTDKAALFFVGLSRADVRGQGKQWLRTCWHQDRIIPTHLLFCSITLTPVTPSLDPHRSSQPNRLYRLPSGPRPRPRPGAPLPPSASSHSVCPRTSPRPSASPEHFSAGEEAGRIEHPRRTTLPQPSPSGPPPPLNTKRLPSHSRPVRPALSHFPR